MSRPPALAIVLLTLSMLTSPSCSKRKSGNEQGQWVETHAIIEQAKPVRNWLQAIRARDMQLFKTVFSERIAKYFQKRGWKRMMAVYKTLWEDKLGDFDIEELDFQFLENEFDEQRGRVVVSKGKQSFPPISVLFEDGVWRVDEY